MTYVKTTDASPDITLAIAIAPTLITPIALRTGTIENWPIDHHRSGSSVVREQISQIFEFTISSRP
jgi:hypothetical protein